MPVISLAAEKIGIFWGFPISNSLLATWIVMALLFLWAWRVSASVSLVPSRLQSVTELLVGGLYDFFGSIAGHHIKKFFPLVASLFLFIITANWFGLLPGIGTIGFLHTPAHGESTEVSHEAIVSETHDVPASDSIVDTHAQESTTIADVAQEAQPVTAAEVVEEAEEVEFIPVLRGPNADLNMTLAMAIISVVALQYFGFTVLGATYGKKFLNFSDPIQFVLGILESVSDLSKIISFAFRLFGNIFAGEVLLTVMAFLMPFIVPLPFMFMELFVGFIQALVFSMLTAVFLNVAVSHEE